MKFVLDVENWRCGDRGPHQLGLGVTQLLNDEGFQCCLGQFGEQCGVERAALLGVNNPIDLWQGDRERMPLRNADFEDLIEINDSTATDARAKIEAIRECLDKRGHELEIKGSLYEAAEVVRKAREAGKTTAEALQVRP